MTGNKSHHTTEAERLLEEWQGSIADVKEKLINPDSEFNPDVVDYLLQMQDLTLKAAQVHATLANAMKP